MDGGVGRPIDGQTGTRPGTDGRKRYAGLFPGLTVIFDGIEWWEMGDEGGRHFGCLLMTVNLICGQ